MSNFDISSYKRSHIRASYYQGGQSAIALIFFAAGEIFLRIEVFPKENLVQSIVFALLSQTALEIFLIVFLVACILQYKTISRAGPFTDEIQDAQPDQYGYLRRKLRWIGASKIGATVFLFTTYVRSDGLVPFLYEPVFSFVDLF